MIHISQILTRYYPVWLVATAVVAFLIPGSFTWVTGGWITGSLALVMLGMGLTLSPLDFKKLRFSDSVARTVSIEVGMQNGGMAMMLAKTHFAANPLAAVPMVFSAVMQNVLGSLLSGWWRGRTGKISNPGKSYVQEKKAKA